MYIADPSAHIRKDSKLYIYGSPDESTNYYCSWRHHDLTTTNMIHRDIEENVFRSKGENDQVPSGNADEWIELSCKPENTEGVQTLLLNFIRNENELFELDWFIFE